MNSATRPSVTLKAGRRFGTSLPAKTGTGPSTRLRTGPSAKLRTGFTLIEVLVVVLIISVMIGVVGVNLLRGPEDQVREEAERLAMLLTAARQEAILQGQMYAFSTSRDGYRFLRPDERGRLRPVNDEVLHPRRLPPGVAIVMLKVDGAGEAARDGLVLPPSGELAAFRIGIAAGAAYWLVVGDSGGRISAQANRNEGAS